MFAANYAFARVKLYAAFLYGVGTAAHLPAFSTASGGGDGSLTGARALVASRFGERGGSGESLLRLAPLLERSIALGLKRRGSQDSLGLLLLAALQLRLGAPRHVLERRRHHLARCKLRHELWLRETGEALLERELISLALELATTSEHLVQLGTSRHLPAIGFLNGRVCVPPRRVHSLARK